MQVIDPAVGLVCSFAVDVAADVTLNADPVRYQVRIPASIPGYHNTIGVQLYPIENQLAGLADGAVHPGRGGAATRAT